MWLPSFNLPSFRIPALPTLRLHSLRAPFSRLRERLESFTFPKIRVKPIEVTSVPLVRKTPVTCCGWVTASTGKIPSFANPARYWAELRGDTLLLYPASILLQTFKLNSGSPDCQAYGVSCPESPSIQALEMLPEGLIRLFAGITDPYMVLSFVLPVTRVTAKQLELQFVLRHAGSFSSTAICVRDLEVFEEWNTAFFNAQTEEEGAKSLSDFKVIRYVGGGASGRVFLIEDVETKERLALKVISKRSVYLSADAYRHALDERLGLQMVKNHPYVLDMRYALQNAHRFFLVTEYCSGGDMFDLMERKTGPLNEKTVAHVAAQIILALEHIHEFGIVYRDLKLENLLVDAEGNIRIADFGLSKMLKTPTGALRRTKTFCGTMEYIAPEMLRGEMYGQALDMWALGVLMYELMVGKAPFSRNNSVGIYHCIAHGPIFFPEHLSEAGRDLIQQLLKRNPEERLGANGFNELKQHPLFEGIDWSTLNARRPAEGPLMEQAEYARRAREMEERSGATTARSPRRKSRRELQQERALQLLLADVREDEQYVDALQRQSAESGGEKSPTRLMKPRSPMAKRAGAVMAGYSFCSDMSPV